MNIFRTPETPRPIHLDFPMALVTMDLSATEMLVYMLLLNRSNLSARGGDWVDMRGRVFVYYPIHSLAEALGRSEAGTKKALESCLNGNGETSGNSTNIDYLRNKNRPAYDNLEFRLGKDYFSYLSNGKTDANRCFKEILESENLSEQDRKIANSLYKLTDYYVQLGTTNQDWAQGSGKYNYADFWKMLQEMTSNPNTIDEKTGDVPYSVAMYREVASQISSNMRQFRNAGVTEQQFRDIITAAEQYLSGLDKNQYSNLYETLIPQTQNAITNAKDIISSVFDSSVKDMAEQSE